jgi:hypothetical protein
MHFNVHSMETHSDSAFFLLLFLIYAFLFIHSLCTGVCFLASSMQIITILTVILIQIKINLNVNFVLRLRETKKNQQQNKDILKETHKNEQKHTHTHTSTLVVTSALIWTLFTFRFLNPHSKSDEINSFELKKNEHHL